MGSLTYILRDKDTAIGIPDQAVTIRKGPAFIVDGDTHTFTDVAGKPGAYMLTDSSGVVSGFYKAYVNTVVDESFGGPSGREILRGTDLLFKSGGTMTGDINMGAHKITNLPAPTANEEPETKGRVATFLTEVAENLVTAIATCLLKAGGTMSGTINMNSNRITNLPTPVSSAEAETKGDADNRFIQRLIGAAAQQIYSQLIFRNRPPLFLQQATNLLEGANRKFVEDYVNLYIQGLVTTDQQSGNLLRVLFSGTAEVNRIYITMETALIAAESFAAANRQMIVLIEGAGVDGAVQPNYNLLPAGTIDPYVHIYGLSRHVVLRVDEDTYNASAGKNIIGNSTIDNANEDASTTFINRKFIGVNFLNSFGSGSPSYSFANCEFYGGCEIQVPCTFDSDCKGSVYESINEKFIIFGDIEVATYKIINNKGDIRGRRILGRKGANVASADKLILGDGNNFLVTGILDISYIENTHWEDGSVIYLEFASALTILDTELPINPDEAGIITNAGALSVASGDILTLMLLSNKEFWRII